MKIKILIFMGIFVGCQGTLHAQFLPEFSDPEHTLEYLDSTSYVDPNENHPFLARDILHHAPAGIYVSVGTERGFIGTALCPNATHLLLIDHDPQVIRFNQMNTALLHLARDRNDYLHLRFKATHEEWLTRMKGTPETILYADRLKYHGDWVFWQRLMKYGNFLDFNTPSESKFQNANYLYDDTLFNRLSQMAKRGHIEVRYVEMHEGSSRSPLIAAIQSSGLKISVLDLSNLWVKGYLEPQTLADAIDQFRPVSEMRSLILFSKYTITGIDSQSYEWRYFAYSFDYLNNRYYTLNTLTSLQLKVVDLGTINEKSIQEITPPPFLGKLDLPQADPKTEEKNSYIPPNEKHPIRSKKLLDQAPPGIYVAVGAERGFIGATLCEKASHLLLIDSDPDIIRYDRINAALLGIATNLDHYRHLRFEANHNEWIEQSLTNRNVPYTDELKNESNFQFWRNWMTNLKFGPFHSNPHENPHEEFKEANYLYDDAQFQKLSQMAKQGHIQADVIDLRNSASMGIVVSAIQSSGLKIAVMDLSNVWEIAYLKPSQLTQVTRLVQDASLPNTVVLFTARSCENKDLEDNNPKLFTQETWTTVVRWIYFGYTFDHLNSRSDAEVQSVFSEIPNFEAHREEYPLRDTLNGKPIWAKDLRYYNVYDLETFPASERERILTEVIDAPTFEDALRIASQTVDVYIADETEARKYGEKYVLPEDKRQWLDTHETGWKNDAAFFCSMNPSYRFIVMVDPSIFHQYYVAHELIHRLIRFDLSTIPLQYWMRASNIRGMGDLRSRIETISRVLEEFIISQIEQTHMNRNEMINGVPYSQIRAMANKASYGKMAQSLQELRLENRMTPQQVKDLVETLLQTYKLRLPNISGNPNPIFSSIEALRTKLITDPLFMARFPGLSYTFDRLKNELQPLYPEHEFNVSLYPILIEGLITALEATQDPESALKFFQNLSDALEQTDSISQKEKDAFLLRQIKFLNTPPGRVVLNHILESPSQMAASGAQFGAALFVKHILQYIFGTNRSNLENFIQHMPQSLMDYLIFSVGSAIGRGSYNMGVELPFQFYRKLVYKKLILASAKNRKNIAENFSKSEINYLRQYQLYKPFFMNQAALIGGLLAQQLWENGDIDGKALFRSMVSLWAAQALVTFTVENGIEFAVLKWSGRVWKLKNLAGPWGWAALAAEWGLIFFGAEEIEKTATYLYERKVAISDLKSKWASLSKKVLSPNSSLESIKEFYDHEFHPAFAHFRIFLMQDVFLANQNYMRAFEDLRKTYDLIYETSLKIKEAERNLELAKTFNWPDPDPVAQEQMLQYESEIGSLKQRICLLEADYNPAAATYRALHSDHVSHSCSAAFNRNRTTIEIPPPIQWKENYERLAKEFHAQDESIAALNSAATYEREKNFSHHLMRTFFSNQEQDLQYVMHEVESFSQDPDVIQALPITNLMQEKSIVDHLMSQSTNDEIRSFLKQKSFALNIELLNLISFLKDPFEMDLDSKEEKALEEEYNQIVLNFSSW